MTVHFHHHEEVCQLSLSGLLVGIDDIVNSQYTSADALDFLDQLAKLDLNRDQVDRDLRLEVQLSLGKLESSTK